MEKNISVKKAIQVGHLIINIPCVLIFLVVILLGFLSYDRELIPLWAAILSILLGLILSWLYWSFAIVKWRIWAFENVRNVYELRKRAIEERLIWKDDSIFNLTEIRTKKEKEILTKLSDKFSTEDEYIEDKSLPSKVEIYASKKVLIFRLFIGFFLFFISIYFYFIRGDIKNYIIGSIFISISLYMIYLGIRNLEELAPKIIISNRGIETAKFGFFSWDNIFNEDVVRDWSNNSMISSLIFYHISEEHIYEVKIGIDELNTNYDELLNYLKTYRIRYDKK